MEGLAVHDLTEVTMEVPYGRVTVTVRAFDGRPAHAGQGLLDALDLIYLRARQQILRNLIDGDGNVG